MEEIIKWCNENNGFLTGLLSLLTVIVSIIAIVVSIKTARMPYKKSIVLTSTTTFLIGQNNFSGQVVSQFSGVSINAANVGNRNINLVYLGLGIIKDGRIQKMQTIDRDLGGDPDSRPLEHYEEHVRDRGSCRGKNYRRTR